MRACVAVVLAFALGACASRTIGLAPPPAPDATAQAAPPPSPGEWKFSRNIDRATGKPVGHAHVITTRVTARVGQLYAKPAGLQLQCFKDKPVVLMTFAQKIGSNRSASLTYRFDDKPPRDSAVHFQRDYKSVVIEDRTAVERFVTELRSANKLFVSIDSLIVGITRAEFPVQGAETAIAAGYADCPLQAGRAVRTSALGDGR